MSAPLKRMRRRSGKPAPTSEYTTAATDSNLYRRQDGFAAPTAEDRADAAFRAEAEQRGYGIFVRCLVCRRALTSARSLEKHVGPTCLARISSRTVLDDCRFSAAPE